ncbi:AAA family ATPase [bacterium]|nr:AAA family ATPase [bacterium]
MRPLRLTMTAFGPYAGTEVVDFDALAELGLFVVAGKNGSGKTTIFDALHYALYGILPGRRASYIRLKSDHADDSTECQVTLDFAAHNTQWRVERSPKQKRSKRRGTGTTEAPAVATLFRLNNGTPTAVTNRVEEVRAKCVELVGLSGKQFERVALLPQGQFSRVLTESSTERRELLRALFSSEIFDNATSLLTDAAAQATAADRAVLERLDHRQGVLTDELSMLTGHVVADSTGSSHDALLEHQHAELASQTAAVADLNATAQHAAQAHQAATDIAQRIKRRDLVRQELERHTQADPQHQADLTRLHNARAAVPVATHAQSLTRHQEQRRVADQRIFDLHQQLHHALAAAGLDQLTSPAHQLTKPHARDDAALTVAALDAIADRIDTFDARLTDRRDSALRVQDLTAAIAQTQGDLRRLDNETRNLHEHHQTATARLRQATAELTDLEQAADVNECETALRTAEARLTQRTELAEIEIVHSQLVRQATELDTTIDRLEQARDAAVHAQSAHTSAQEKADLAFAAYKECERRNDAVIHYQAATLTLTSARSALAQARAESDQLWDAFIAGTAARIAHALVDDEPCPVCGSCEHPQPAAIAEDGQIVTDSQVAAARERSDAMQTKVQTIESDIETLRAADADITSLSTTELAAQITTTKAMALGARTIADETRQAAGLYEQVEAELRQVRTDRTALDDELRTTDQRRSRLEGALGAAANEPVAILRAQALDAASARTQADQLVERRAELTQTVHTTEQEIDTIGLNQIAVQSRRASSADQLIDRQQALDVASERYTNADRALAECSRTPVRADQDLEVRARAARHARGLITDMLTALARQHDAADAVRRAQSILDERLSQSLFTTVDQAVAAFVEPHLLAQLEAQTAAHITTTDRLHGQLHELTGLPDSPPDLAALQLIADQSSHTFAAANTALITATTNLDRITSELRAIESERARCQTTDLDTRRLERVAALAKGDNERNTSFENWVLAAHLRDVVELANIRLARSTHQRFQLCVLDDGENKRGTWGLDLGVEDTVTGTQRPTAGLSGGELFQASLALALGLADAVMNQSAGVRVDALFIDEGFGSLDETSVERAIDLLDELRDRGAMVGVITHVPALLEALPLGVSVIESPNGQGSTIRQTTRAA